MVKESGMRILQEAFLPEYPKNSTYGKLSIVILSRIAGSPIGSYL